ncbi:MAG: hypothetical protein LC104_07120 [Bacteroidales bacterium]|nr:hypothetical protein [Bacteroidales bacterium]
MSQPQHVRADQLIYSNVEAEFSPVGRRGFQVWLCSPCLKESQREIARRIEDFTWPAADSAREHLTVRLSYFHVPNVGAVLARTVPVKERDALNRAGRFHAHALILKDAEFDRFGANPFAIFDRFTFQNRPDTDNEHKPWQTGELPNAEELPLDAVPSDPAELPDVSNCLPMLARWLEETDDPRPLALPDHPDQVANWLRVLFRHLPPALRRKASFDTLSTGQSLTTLPFRFVGGYDPATVRDWPYRRSYRIEWKTGTMSIPPTPQENPLLDHFSQKWTCDTSDADLEAGYRMYQVMQDSTADVSELKDIPEPILTHALQAPGAEAIWNRWIAERFQTDIPQPRLREIVKPLVEEWFGPPQSDRLKRLQQPIPVPQIGKWLFARCPKKTVSQDCATELLEWTNEQLKQGIKDDPIPRLMLLALASAGKTKELRKLFLGKGSWRELIDTWFRDWFISQVTHKALAADLVTFARAVLNDMRTDPAVLKEYDILAAIHAESTPPTHDDKLIATATAFRDEDAAKLRKLLQENAILEQVLTPILDRSDAGFVFAWGQPPYEDCPGAYLRVEFSEPAIPGVRALYMALETLPLAALMIRTRAQGEARKSVRPSREFHTATAEADKLYTARKWDKLEKELAKLTDATDFRVFLVEHFHKIAKSPGGDIPCQRWSLTTREPILWVGWHIISNGRELDNFKKLYPLVTRVIQDEPVLAPMRIAALVSAVTSTVH